MNEQDTMCNDCIIFAILKSVWNNRYCLAHKTSDRSPGCSRIAACHSLSMLDTKFQHMHFNT